MTKQPIILDLLHGCDTDHIKVTDSINLYTMDIITFSHPKYNLYWDDKTIGYLYEDYKDAFVSFEIVNN